jgi:hypothetical protein
MQAEKGSLSLRQKLTLLRKGRLGNDDIAAAVADFGQQNFLEAKGDVEELLQHPDSIVRYNAMGALAYEWGTCSVPERIIDILMTDEDEDCRGQAAGALGSLFRDTRDNRTMHVLSSVVQDPDQRDDLRSFAYTAFLDVVGIPRANQPNPVNLVVGPQELRTVGMHLKTIKQKTTETDPI